MKTVRKEKGKKNEKPKNLHGISLFTSYLHSDFDYANEVLLSPWQNEEIYLPTTWENCKH